jgi:hypothetical protein
LLAAAVVFILYHRSIKSAGVAAPLLVFLLLLKSMSWTMYWYILLLPALILIFSQWRRWAIVLSLAYALACGRSLFHLRADFDHDLINVHTNDVYRICLWVCDPQTPPLARPGN